MFRGKTSRILNFDWWMDDANINTIQFVYKHVKSTNTQTIVRSSGSADETLWDLRLVPDSVDVFLGSPTIFTMIVITQGLFGGAGLEYTPNFVKKLQKNAAARVLFITLVAYTATSDAETAIVCTLVYYVCFYV